jgi:hypothetical protein
VFGIFPDRNSAIRLTCAVLAEQLAEWAERRRYRLDVLASSRIALITNDYTTEEQNPTRAALTAYSAAAGSRGGPFIHHDVGLDRRR